jgi:hypothetical protein
MCISASAAQIDYGDFPANDVTFLQVTEDSTTNPSVQLFGPPAVSGNGMSFTPTSAFSADSTGGGIVNTDGTLTTSIQVNHPNTVAIHNVAISERGDYTLDGTGTTVTQATVTAPVTLTVTELNGVAVAPVVIFSGNLSFSPSGGTYDLVNDQGDGVAWTGNLMVNVDARLAALSISGSATKIDYWMDNTLQAVSEQSSLAFIAKKNAIVGLQVNMPMNNVPEPSTMVLLGVGIPWLALVALRRRRSQAGLAVDA